MLNCSELNFFNITHTESEYGIRVIFYLERGCPMYPVYNYIGYEQKCRNVPVAFPPNTRIGNPDLNLSWFQGPFRKIQIIRRVEN